MTIYWCIIFILIIFFQQEKATNSGGCVANTKPKKTKRGDINYERTCKAIYR
ncbi:hypothetical protein I230019B6_00380 [Firmicutes bacterium i23-0019-B6]